MKRYGAPDAKPKDTQRNNAQFLHSTLQVERLTHCHRQEDCGARYADKQAIDPRTAIWCRNTQRLQKTYTTHFARQ